jgi:hypothetical protein
LRHDLTLLSPLAKYQGFLKNRKNATGQQSSAFLSIYEAQVRLEFDTMLSEMLSSKLTAIQILPVIQTLEDLSAE